MANSPTILKPALRLGCVALWLLGAGSGFALDPAPSNAWTQVERYTYATFDKSEPTQTLERLTLEFRTGPHEQQTAYLSKNQEGSETVLIRLTPDGKLLSGERSNSDTSGTLVTTVRVWIDAGEILIETTPAGRDPRRRTWAHNGIEVAAEPSLMNILRGFPFGSGLEKQILMATFSQYVIPMTIRQLEDHCIEVPAGIFECYTVEATVSFLGLKITTTYWLSRDPPHVLVRYQGKRGLFLSPTYITELVSGETNGVPLRPAGSAR